MDRHDKHVCVLCVLGAGGRGDAKAVVKFKKASHNKCYALVARTHGFLALPILQPENWRALRLPGL